MTVAELVAALQLLPQDVVVHDCNRGMLELELGRSRCSITLELLAELPTNQAAQASVRDEFAEARRQA
jgi:hypothetical protein